MKKLLSLVITFLLTHFTVIAQQQMENSMSQYYRYRTLWNAGFTGLDGTRLYAMQNRSWVGFNGAPVMTNISGELNFGENSSAGLQIMSDVTGILHRSFGVFNYAYRVKLQEQQQLRIGISLAFSSDRLNSKYIDEGGAVDPLIMNNINATPQFDGNIGVVYINKKITLGASFYRLKENFKSNNPNTANLALAQLGVMYDLSVMGDARLNLKPLLGLRLYRNTNAVFDVGAQFDYDKLVNTMLVYQSSGNIRAGAGLRLKEIAEVNFFYNTNIRVANSASQQYEMGIGFYIAGKKDLQ